MLEAEPGTQNGAGPGHPREWSITWKEIMSRMEKCPLGKVWGVPRGGQIIAGMTGRAVDRIEDADIIVDDIIDSGKTRDHFVQKTGKPFWALIDKSNWGENQPWIVFPWEQDSVTDVEGNVVRLLQYIGEDASRDGLKETPARVVKALREMTAGYAMNPQKILSKTFDVPYDELVILRDLQFWSLCEHHVLPFHGVVHISYIPNGRIIGISKLARLVDCFSRRLQVQERMTQQIAKAIETVLNPHGVGVVVRASHTCMAMRGVNKPADMVTSCLLGLMKDDGRARQEFLGLAK